MLMITMRISLSEAITLTSAGSSSNSIWMLRWEASSCMSEVVSSMARLIETNSGD